MKPSILIDLERCVGCWTCSMACKVGHHRDVDEWPQYIRTVGSGRGIDEPAGVYPDLHMSWMPIHTSGCTLCGERIVKGEEPFCTYNCPTRAMTFGDREDQDSAFSAKKRELEADGYCIYELPVWEHSRRGIYYAEKARYADEGKPTARKQSEKPEHPIADDSYDLAPKSSARTGIVI